MDYPFWDVGVGYGLLMAAVAVVHVFVSHFAIGGGLYLVVAETAARRAGEEARLEFLERLSRFFVLTTLVFGALTGVGIWFVIGLLNPAATEALIHNFVWGWATEWTFFVVEIASAIVYFHGWRRMPAKHHMIVGWMYFAAAWLSLFVINGILAFMLTPGKWLASGSFADGFFNPTFWPMLVFRTGVCVLLAGVYAMTVAARCRPPARARFARYNAAWATVGLAAMVPSGYWYWRAIPADVTMGALERMPFIMTTIRTGVWFGGALAALLLVFGWWLPRRLNPVAAAAMMVAALGLFGGYEWMREAIRKPYVIYGYMYGNAVEVARADEYRRDGYLAHIAFRTGDDGADLFRHACRSCHTVDGYKPLAPALSGTDPAFVGNVVRATGIMRATMPPFLGTDDEADLIASHIRARIDTRPLGEIHGLEGAALGRRVFDVRCGGCHQDGGFRDVRTSLVGLDADDYNDIFDNGGDFGEGMPDFTGSDADRAALIEYLSSLQQEGALR
jgi:mono/diheme cytochrome c family protein